MYAWLWVGGWVDVGMNADGKARECRGGVGGAAPVREQAAALCPAAHRWLLVLGMDLHGAESRFPDCPATDALFRRPV